MKINLMHLLQEFLKLESKRKAMGAFNLSSEDEERHAYLKDYLNQELHGKELEKDRRTDFRVPISVRVRYRSGEDFANNYISNLSSGGVFIATPKPLPLNTHVKLFLIFEGEKKEIEVEGKVVWENTQGGKLDDITKPGMGIKFLKVDTETRVIIDSFVHDILEEQARIKQELKEERKKRKESEKRVWGILGRKKK